MIGNVDLCLTCNGIRLELTDVLQSMAITTAEEARLPARLKRAGFPLRGSMRDFFVGIDGGGTKTRCAISDETGKVIGQGLAGGCKVNKHISLKSAQENVASAVAIAMEKSGILNRDMTSVCFGIPGIEAPDGLENARQLVKSTGLNDHVLMVNDAKIAWAGALVCRPGVVVVSGNGFDVCGVSEHGEEIIGLSSPGILYGASCEDIEHQLLYESLVANEGSPLLVKMLNLFGLREQDELIRNVRTGKYPWKELSGKLLPFGVEAAQDDDQSAIHILEWAGRTLGLAVVMVMKSLRIHKTPVSFIGGAFEVCGGMLSRPFEATVLSRFPEATIVFPRLKPAGGALLLAMRAVGRKIDETLTRHIAHTLSTKTFEV